MQPDDRVGSPSPRPPDTVVPPPSTLSPPPGGADAGAAADSLGYIAADLPLKVEVNEPFEIDLILKPKNPGYPGAAKVFMEQTNQMKYEPRTLGLKAGERKTVRATVLKSSSGLASVVATADGWDSLDTVINSGFWSRLKSNIGEPIHAGSRKTFSISFKDDEGDATPLDAPVTVTLQGSKLLMLVDGNWHERVELTVPAGSISTVPIEIKATSWAADTALVSAEVRTMNNMVIHNENFWINVLPRWYVPLLVAILGGVMYSVYRLSQRLPNRRGAAREFLLGAVLPGLASGGFAGALAFLLASWGVLGIKVDTTTLQGFLILGFLFAYVGIDFILKTVTRREEEREGRAGGEQEDAKRLPPARAEALPESEASG